MTVEGISKPGMTYHGSVSAPEAVRYTADKQVERAEKLAETEPVLINQTIDGQVYGKSLTGEKSKEDDKNLSQPTNEAVKKAVDEINKKMKNSEAIFGIHEETNRVTIKIVDKESKEVLKEYPPERTLDMIAKVWEMAGLMVDEKR